MRGVSLKDTTDFIRQLADLLESGLPMVRSLNFLEAQATNKKFKNTIKDIRDRCVGGSSLSAALAQHPAIFPPIFSVLTKAGETGGTLDATLRRLSVFNEKQLEIQGRVRAALAYPLLMAGVGALTVVVLLVFVVPRMAGIFEDMGSSLPLPTQILLFLSGLFTKYFLFLILAVAGGTWAGWNFYKTAKGKHSIDQFKLKVPIFGVLAQKIEIGRFSQTLSTLLASGVSILEALKVSSDTVENSLIRGELNASYIAVKEGSRLSASLSSSRAIPAVVIQMIGVGEESGHLERTLQKIAENYEREVDQSVKVFLSLLEPLLILALGLIVGFMVIAILLPIFEISLSAK
jgi:type II secretory pathway component PulF